LGDYFSKIAQSGNRLLILLNDLLDLAKLEAGKVEFSFAEGDLAKIGNGSNL
jgi:signal transduction histidine kinase